jgi:hypothetical protein
MRECFMYGSVRGAAGNGGPYRDPRRQPPNPEADPGRRPRSRPLFRLNRFIAKYPKRTD